jgi:hypothetical protein
LYNNGSSGVCNPILTNCVLFHNGEANTFYNDAASISARYSLFDISVTGYTAVNSLTVNTTPFANATSTQLRPESPAIDAGDPATLSATIGNTDLAGNPRFVNSLVDIGAYEFQGILEIFTLKDGDWSDATLWSAGRLPQLGERVRLKHVVTIPTGHLALAKTLVYDVGANVIYAIGGRLQLGQ